MTDKLVVQKSDNVFLPYTSGAAKGRPAVQIRLVHYFYSFHKRLTL